ncbi:hypothetical protein XF_0746 [Xylella fastidiosa 9a5c]|uniref:Uncharacterized protein n=1 Tax=Xylella fastidiosa (strain 9a5c) TaxID=160492 RepID=Q9PFD2_XYLFA|nr:hypothetical protein XF_0746 [Xylella fastidiosa 9a5c]
MRLANRELEPRQTSQPQPPQTPQNSPVVHCASMPRCHPRFVNVMMQTLLHISLTDHHEANHLPDDHPSCNLLRGFCKALCLETNPIDADPR